MKCYYLEWKKEKSCMILVLSSIRSFMRQQFIHWNSREIISTNIRFGISTTVTYIYYCYHQSCQLKMYIHWVTVHLLRKAILLQGVTCMLRSINIWSVLFASPSIPQILHTSWLVVYIVHWIVKLTIYLWGHCY